MPAWEYEIEDRENVKAFLREMDKNLGILDKTEATFDIYEYLALSGELEKTFRLGKIYSSPEELLKEKRLEFSDLTICFNPIYITGERLIDFTEHTRTTCIGLSFKYADDSILVLLYNDSITVESKASTVPEIVEKYGKRTL